MHLKISSGFWRPFFQSVNSCLIIGRAPRVDNHVRRSAALHHLAQVNCHVIPPTAHTWQWLGMTRHRPHKFQYALITMSLNRDLCTLPHSPCLLKNSSSQQGHVIYFSWYPKAVKAAENKAIVLLNSFCYKALLKEYLIIDNGLGVVLWQKYDITGDVKSLINIGKITGVVTE